METKEAEEVKKKAVIQENIMFFLFAVGKSFGTDLFTQAVVKSSVGMSQFSTDNVGRPGYIRIDSSAIRSKGEDAWLEFAEKISSGLLGRASFEFGSRAVFKGELAEQFSFERDGYAFSLHIKHYERDGAHKFEIINPEDLLSIPAGEKLGRLVYLTIAPA